MSAATGRPPANQKTRRDRLEDRAARPADTRVQVPGGHENLRNDSAGQDTSERQAPMTTISEIEDRLNAVAFSGRSYTGATREEIAAAYNAAVANFEANAAVDCAYLIERVHELETAIITAASDLAAAASYVAARYAGTPDEAREIRVAIGEPIDALVNATQGTTIASDEDAQ